MSCNKEGHDCIRFGFHSRASYQAILNRDLNKPILSPIATYLLTHDRSPFCAGHYKVTVQISETEESKRHGGEVGILNFKIKNHNSETNLMFNANPVYFGPGSNHTFMTIGDVLDNIKSMKVAYRFKQTLNPLTWRVFTPKIYVAYIKIESMELNTAFKLCPVHALPVVDEEKAVFDTNSCNSK